MPVPDIRERAEAHATSEPALRGERALLARLIEGPASGAELARLCGQTRAALWKRIDALRAAGVAIDARPGQGYVLRRPLELLEAGTIQAALPPALRAQVASLEVAWSIGSSNSVLLERVAPAADTVQVLLAERQTGGRGRRGRSWASPLAANLYLSLARSFAGGLARLPGLSVVAGIATAEALHALGFVGVALKWPNDLVVVDGDGLRKLGGLLVEGGGEAAGPARAVVGLGLNIDMPAAAATAIDQPWIDLAQLGARAPARNAIAATLLAHWLPAFAEFDACGLEPFLARHARLDALAGRAVQVDGASGRRDGQALGLAPDGALRVRIDGTEQRIHAGEVSVRYA